MVGFRYNYSGKLSEITDSHFRSTVQQHSVSYAASNRFLRSRLYFKIPHSQTSLIPLLISLALLDPLLVIPLLIHFHLLHIHVHCCKPLCIWLCSIPDCLQPCFELLALSSPQPPALPPLVQRCCTGTCKRQG